MKTNTHSKLSRVIAIIAAMVITLAMTVIPSGALNSAEIINEKKDGVFAVYYAMPDETQDRGWVVAQIGTCFLINEQYVVTAYHTVHYTPEDAAYMIQNFGKNWASKMQIQVYYQGDSYVQATEVKEMANATADYTVLKLKTPINGRSALKFREDVAHNVATTQEIFALGYPNSPNTNQNANWYQSPTLSQQLDDINTYTPQDVDVRSGNVNKFATIEGNVLTLKHSAILDSGMSGGPLFDADGAVVGINTGYYTNNIFEYYSIVTDMLLNALNQMNIEYNTIGDRLSDTIKEAEALKESDYSADTFAAVKDELAVAKNMTGASADEKSAEADKLGEAIAALAPAGSKPVADDETSTPAIDKSELEEAIQAAKKIDTKKYDSKALETFNSKITEAESVLMSADSQEAINAAATELKNAQSNLKEKNNTILYAGIAAGAVVIIAVIIIIIVVSKKNKRDDLVYEPAQAPAPAFQSGGFAQSTPQAAPSFIPSTTNMGGAETGVLSSSSNETSVLSSSSNETSVLSSKPYAKLTRKSTGETVTVSNPSFLIGKDARKVNYCVPDNNAVSRCHAKIVKDGKGVSIVDVGSSNGTFVNGLRCDKNASVALSNGDKIVLADEEFKIEIL